MAPRKRADDLVNVRVHPAATSQVGGTHYTELAIQPWAAMESWLSTEEFSGYLRGCAIKYLARCRKKGGLEDLKKARHYLDKMIELDESLENSLTPTPSTV